MHSIELLKLFNFFIVGIRFLLGWNLMDDEKSILVNQKSIRFFGLVDAAYKIFPKFQSIDKNAIAI